MYKSSLFRDLLKRKIIIPNGFESSKKLSEKEVKIQRALGTLITVCKNCKYCMYAYAGSRDDNFETFPSFCKASPLKPWIDCLTGKRINNLFARCVDINNGNCSLFKTIEHESKVSIITCIRNLFKKIF